MSILGSRNASNLVNSQFAIGRRRLAVKRGSARSGAPLGGLGLSIQSTSARLPAVDRSFGPRGAAHRRPEVLCLESTKESPKGVAKGREPTVLAPPCAVLPLHRPALGRLCLRRTRECVGRR